MRHTGLLKLMAALPLMVWSCSKAGLVSEEISAPEPVQDPWTLVPLEAIPATGKPVTITAGGDETKSQLVVDGSSAKVVWTAGDSFRMYGHNTGDGTASYSEYSTSTGGDLADFTGAAMTEGKQHYYSFYPASASTVWGLYGTESTFIIGFNVPKDQVADPGKLAEGANLSFARSTEPVPANLHFTNACSIIKFRLSGSVVSQVKKVKFIGTKALSEYIVMLPNGDHLEVLPGVTLVGHSTSSSVSLTLTGDVPFATNTDYYISVAPSVQDGFSMVFENADGTQKITRFSSKKLTLSRSKIIDFGTIALGNAFDDHSMDPYLWTEHDSAHGNYYATIAVIPDGYTKEQMDQFKTDAGAGLTALFNTEPYKTYKDYFNVWIMPVASNESGARISDGEPEEQNRDCYFRSTWGENNYDGMSANSERVFSFVANNCPDILSGAKTIDKVPILLIINDTRYGGMAHIWDDGHTYCMVPKTEGSLTWNYAAQEAAGVTATRSDGLGLHSVTAEEKEAIKNPNIGDWTNILVHEFGGHSIARLGDEYWYPANADKAPVAAIAEHSLPVPKYLNISATSVAQNTPWSILFEDGNKTLMAEKSPLYAQRIGVFQGAQVSTFNRWRSEKISCMIDNRFYFSTWQRYLIVSRIRSLAGLGALSFSTFLASDNPLDPNRDSMGSPTLRPEGVSDIVPPRPVPMLPPPVCLEGSPEF